MFLLSHVYYAYLMFSLLFIYFFFLFIINILFILGQYQTVGWLAWG